jgi:hypothetical protein
LKNTRVIAAQNSLPGKNKNVTNPATFIPHPKKPVFQHQKPLADYFDDFAIHAANSLT